MQIADHLFPELPRTNWDLIPIDIETEDSNAEHVNGRPGHFHPFTLDELKIAATRLPSGKACGPDGIPNEILANIARLKPNILLHVFNNCLRQRQFSQKRKEARLVLLHKGQAKPLEIPSSFRPLSMLNTIGKTMERLLLNRLNGYLDTAPLGKSEQQYGFCQVRST